MTVWSCMDLYKNYRDNPVLQTSTTQRNDTITPPDALVCLRIANFTGLINYWKNEKDKDVNSTMEEYYWKTVSKWLTESSWDEKLNPKNNDWPLAVLDVTQRYISNLYEVLIPKDIDYDNDDNTQYPSLLQQLQNRNESDYVQEVLIDLLALNMKPPNNVRIKELIDAFNRNFLNWYQLNVTVSNGEMISYKLALVNGENVCYKLVLSEAVLSGTSSISVVVNANKLDFTTGIDGDYYDNLVLFLEKNIGIDREIFPEDINYNAKNFGFGSPFFHFPIDFTDRNPVVPDLSTSNGGNTFLFQVAFMKTLKMSLRQTYVAYSVGDGDRSCSDLIDKKTCQQHCRNEIIENTCGCSTETMNNAGKNPCLLGEFEQCLKNFTGKEDNKCR